MIYIIIPTYNEKENIEKLVKRIFYLQIKDLKVLIIDDNSSDKTGEIAENLSAKGGPASGGKYPVEVLHRSGKLGLGSAYRAGFKFALEKNADFIFEMDADFSHNPDDIPRLLHAVQDGADLAIGSRKIKGGKIIGWDWRRHFCSDGAMLFSRLILNLKTQDLTAGFRCFRAETLCKIDYNTITSNGYAFQVEMIYHLEKQNFKIKEVPVIFSDRQKGKSKLGKKEIIDFFKTIFRLRFKSSHSV